MITPLFWLTLVLALAEWIAVWRGWRKVRYVTKPGTMLALIAWFTQTGAWRGPLIWFGLALAFSLAGDVFLMLPERFFLWGLVAFLTGHLLYVVGFNIFPPALGWETLAAFGVVLLVSVMITTRVYRGVTLNEETRPLRLPLVAYSTVISLMLLSALLTFWRSGWPAQAANFASIGALLFFISDSILAVNRFVKPVVQGDLVVMVTYQMGQLALAAGALLAFA